MLRRRVLPAPHLRAFLLLLALRACQPSFLRHLTSRPLREGHRPDESAGGGPTGRGALVDASASAGSPEALTHDRSNAAGRQGETPWELGLAPHLDALAPRHDPNTTKLRGPPRLVGTYQGRWLKRSYGGALRRADFLSSEGGTIILRLPEELNPPPSAAALAAADAAAQLRSGTGRASGGGRDGGGGYGEQEWGQGREPELLPGGVQPLQGELVLRDGPRITDREVRFRLRGDYVAAAGALHVVLEPQLPITAELKAAAGADPDEEADAGAGFMEESGVGMERARGGGGGGGGGREAHGADPGAHNAGGDPWVGEQAGGAQSYREALRSAVRLLEMGGPSVARRLVQPTSPPPLQPAPAPGSVPQAGLAPPPKRPPPPAARGLDLALALRQTCEFRAHFRVYYKGDPEAAAHVGFLGLDRPPSAASPPPPPLRGQQRRRHNATQGQEQRERHHAGAAGGGAAAGGGVGPLDAAQGQQPGTARHAPVAAAAAAAAATSVSGGGGGDSATRGRRRLAADTEIYHSTQVQLHGGGGGGALLYDPYEDSGSAGAAASAPDLDHVYGMPPGMDPRDPDLVLVGLVASPNCGLVLGANVSSMHLERYFRQVVRYSVVVTAVTIGEIVLVALQMEASSTPSAAARMSLYSVCMQAIMDAYQCLLHLTGALVVDALFAAFAAIAFLQFLLFAMFEMQQTLLVWRAQRTNGTGGGDFWTVRRDMSAVYTRFYAMLLLGLILLFSFQSRLPLLLLGLHSWWLPQLLHSAATDTRPPLKQEYLWGMSALRLVSPLYMYGCPHNLLRLTPRPGFCAALAGWVVLQAALVALQMRAGPRAFVPRALLPRRYDYHRPATKREMGLDEPHTQHPAAAPVVGSGANTAAAAGDAALSRLGGRAVLRRLAAWLPPLPSGQWFRRPGLRGWGGGAGAGPAAAEPPPPHHHRSARGGGGGDGGGSDGGDVETGHGSKECVICMNPVPLLPLGSRMLTPCGHFFHEACLRRWMDVKMDCPTCRRPLPPA